MDVRELRIGNFVHNNVESFQIQAKDLIFLLAFDNEHYSSPISLTEEWLLKFGFSKNPIGIYEKYNSKLHKTFVVPFDTDHEVRLSMPYGNGIMTVAKDITSVHHLQNLYYFSTFQELEVKP